MDQSFKDIDSYLAAQTEKDRKALNDLRRVIKTAAKDAEEVISYGMPGYRYHGMLVYFAAFKGHCSFFAGNGSTIKQFKDELSDYESTRSAVHFTSDRPLPSSLVKRIVKIRMRENEERGKKKIDAAKERTKSRLKERKRYGKEEKRR